MTFTHALGRNSAWQTFTLLINLRQSIFSRSKSYLLKNSRNFFDAKYKGVDVARAKKGLETQSSWNHSEDKICKK